MMANWKTRVERLEAKALGRQEDHNSEQRLALVFEGFDDVRTWLEGEGRGPDPHRVNDLIRHRRGNYSDMEFAQAVYMVTLWYIAQRRADWTGELPPDLERDPDDWISGEACDPRGTADWR